MKRITDKAFRYTPAASTNIRLTFARIRREQKLVEAERDAKVTTLPQPKPRKTNF